MVELNLGRVVGEGNYFNFSYSKSGTTHTLIGPATATAIRFEPTDVYHYGDKFLVNGVTFTGATQDGVNLPEGFFVPETVVSCFVKGSKLFFKTGGASFGVYPGSPPRSASGVSFTPIAPLNKTHFIPEGSFKNDWGFCDTTLQTAITINSCRCITVGDEIFYEMGGTSAALAYFNIYNTRTNRWRVSATATYVLGYTTMVAVGTNEIYCIGGYTAAHPRVQIYNIKRDTWTLGPQFPANNFGGIGAYYAPTNTIYFGGGTNGSANQSIFYKLDLNEASPAWVSVGANVPDANSYRSGFDDDGTILYSYSGSSANKLLRMFNMETETWLPSITMPTLTSAAGDIAIKVIGDLVYITGGVTAAEAIQLYTYNLKTGAVTIVPNSVNKYAQVRGFSKIPYANGKLYIPTGTTLSSTLFWLTVEEPEFEDGDVIITEGISGSPATVYNNGTIEDTRRLKSAYQQINTAHIPIMAEAKETGGTWNIFNFNMCVIIDGTSYMNFIDASYTGTQGVGIGNWEQDENGWYIYSEIVTASNSYCCGKVSDTAWDIGKMSKMKIEISDYTPWNLAARRGQLRIGMYTSYVVRDGGFAPVVPNNFEIEVPYGYEGVYEVDVSAYKLNGFFGFSIAPYTNETPTSCRIKKLWFEK